MSILVPLKRHFAAFRFLRSINSFVITPERRGGRWGLVVVAWPYTIFSTNLTSLVKIENEQVSVKLNVNEFVSVKGGAIFTEQTVNIYTMKVLWREILFLFTPSILILLVCQQTAINNPYVVNHLHKLEKLYALHWIKFSTCPNSL